MMVWMWYDCMTSVWWCDSFVCECCEYKWKKLQRNVKQKTDKEKHKKQHLRFSYFATFPPIPRHENFLKTSEDSRKTSSIVFWFVFVYPCISTEAPEGKKCYFSISISNKYTIYKSLQGLQEHHEHTHN